MKKTLTTGILAALMLLPGGAVVLKTAFSQGELTQKTSDEKKAINVTHTGLNENGSAMGPNIRKAPRNLSQARINAVPEFADMPVLYGIHYRTNDWSTVSDLPAGAYSFHPGSTIVLNQESTNISATVNGFYAKGKYYQLTSQTDSAPATVTVYDANTWEVVEGPVEFPMVDDGSLQFHMCSTWMPGTDYGYILSWGSLNWDTFIMSRPLMRLDLNTLEIEKVGEPGKYFQMLFTGADNTLYGIEYAGWKVSSIDIETGEPTELGSLAPGFSGYPDPQSVVTDPVSGITYWAAVDGNSKASALFTINLEDLSTTKIADFPNSEHFQGLYIPYVEDDAPAATTGNKYADGKVQFNVPATTYLSGKDLTGALTAVVTVDGDVTTKEVKAGDAVEIPMALSDGSHKIAVYVKNDVGNGAERIYDTFVGSDVPCSVENLSFLLENGVANLTWDAPTRTVNQGPVDDAIVNYTVIRHPDNEVVATNLKECKFTEKIPTRRDHYYYEIVSFAGDNQGESALSEALSGGTVYEVPFTEGFLNQDDFDSFTVVDANNDQQSWIYMAASQTAYLVGNGVYNSETGFIPTNNDDYLISLPISLKAGVDYRLTTTIIEAMFPETFEIGLSKSTTPSDNDIILKTVSLPFGYNFVEELVFDVKESGEYHLFYHSTTVGNSAALIMDSFRMVIEGGHNAPAGVANLTATAGDLGALLNTISFTASTSTYSGAPLDEITKIEIYRDNGRTPVKTFENPAPGATLTWTDDNVSNGEHTYSIVGFNATGQGKTETVTNWVGLDIPAMPTNVMGKMTSDIKPLFTWDATPERGSHLGYVKTDDVKFRLYKYNPYNWENQWEMVVDEITSPEVLHEGYTSWSSPEWPSQEYVDYAVAAYNEAGVSDLCLIGINLGHPYNLPYAETFGYGFAWKSPWTLHTPTYYYAWNITSGEGLTVKPYDNDGGMLSFTRIDDDSNAQVMEGPRVNIKDTTSPEFSFYMHHGNEADEGDLKLIIYTNIDDEGFKKAAEFDYNNGLKGWIRHSVTLPTGHDNVIIAYGAYAYDASAAIFIDNIKVEEGVAHDVAVQEISADKRVEKGSEGTVTVRVASFGQETTENVEVKLYRDGEEFITETLDALEPNEVVDMKFAVPTSIQDGSKTFTFKAEAFAADDANEANNVSGETTMFVTGSVYPAITDLAGTTDEDGNGVTLSWSTPDGTYIEDVTDTFEDYESFIIDNIGDWTVYDGDGSVPLYFNGPEIPNAFEPQAWQVWVPEEAGFSLERFPMLIPHSGAKYLASWASSDGVSQILANDDWLISCQVLGGSDVSFWTCTPIEGGGTEKYEILYSTTDDDPSSFEVLDKESLTGTTEWQYHIYTLPEDAKYFAIRSCGDAYISSRCVWFLDDICYTPAFGAKGTLDLNGFNIYRDNELIGATTANTFTDTEASREAHVYYVTVVWNKGESLASNEYTSDDVTGVDKMVNTANVRVVTARQTILVSGANGNRIDVYTIDGRSIFRCNDRNEAAISVTSGAYIVKVGNKVVKVIVD